MSRSRNSSQTTYVSRSAPMLRIVNKERYDKHGVISQHSNNISLSIKVVLPLVFVCEFKIK